MRKEFVKIKSRKEKFTEILILEEEKDSLRLRQMLEDPLIWQRNQNELLEMDAIFLLLGMNKIEKYLYDDSINDELRSGLIVNELKFMKQRLQRAKVIK